MPLKETEERLLKTFLAPQWKKIGIRAHHGIDLLLSSLHSKNSCGIGEFYDLLPLIDWCAKMGLDIIQLLPLNDSGDDPSPYSAISALALNPLFLSLHQLPSVKREKLVELQHFNHLPRVAYHDVQSHKLFFLRSYFEEVGFSRIDQKDFNHYLLENQWVKSYALFKALKEKMSKNHWRTWPQELQSPSPDQFHFLLEKHKTDVDFYIFLQYLCYKQLTAVKAYALSKGVFLKGDIPILISSDSADIWKYPDEFSLTYTAGAPPDPLGPEGQAWGLPILNWAAMKKHNYDWWKNRLSYASHFYDLYRIDHVLGFFRIWAIFDGLPSKKGKFIPENPEEWVSHGTHLLTTLCSFTSMLPIAEDLGIAIDSIRATLSDLGICGTKVIRWEKKRVHHQEKYIDPAAYNPVSMTCVSTHDSETLEQWWNSGTDEVKLYAHYKGWDYIPSLAQEQRRDILFDSHHSGSLFHINLLGEYLALFPELVAEEPQQERINLPGTISPTNWTYRIRPTVEEICHHAPLAREMKKIME